MGDYRPLLIGGAVLLVAGLIAALILMRAANNPSSNPGQGSPGHRLLMLARQRNDYKMLIGVPPENPVRWAAVSKISEEEAIVDGFGAIPLISVTAFVVAYPNGQMVDSELAGLRPPSGITGLSRATKRESDLVQLEDLAQGQKLIRVRYGRSTLRPNSRDHYSTTLTNISSRKIRVVRFGGYIRTTQGFKLYTVTGSFYSAQEFREWYGMGSSEWIRPGESVADHNNYGSPPVLWAYYCEAEDGERFLAGAVLEG